MSYFTGSYLQRSGLGNVGSYQSSGIPFLSSSIAISGTTEADIVRIDFPAVTKFIVIRNEASVDSPDAPMKFGFSLSGTNGNNYLQLDNRESFSADFRVSKIFLQAGSTTPTSASITAGLTTILSEQLPNNWSGSSGIG